ncbi:MAG: monothiol glutaredoxin, Grx4 family [Elusimicrobia bacterium]|nr:MAG: monothiol glutaredoxin, Grx4 family [Elusimicrobiota bacterium]
MEDALKKRLEEIIASKRVFLFMKGTPEAPQCGFSNAVIEILRQRNADFGSFDVLSDENVRQGVKEYGNWPTIPQLYVDGKLVGGCDIIKEMNDSGDLEKTLNPS